MSDSAERRGLTDEERRKVLHRFEKLEEEAKTREAKIVEMEKEAEIRRRTTKLFWTIAGSLGGIILILAQIIIWWLNSR